MPNQKRQKFYFSLLTKMKSFIEVRLTFNISGFLALIPLGNDFFSFKCYSSISSFSFSLRTINSEIVESTKVNERSRFICWCWYCTLAVVFWKDWSYCFSFKWIREKHPSIATRLLYVAPRPCLNLFYMKRVKKEKNSTVYSIDHK